MVDSTISSLEELRIAVREREKSGQSSSGEDFVAQHWSLIVAVDQAAHANYITGSYLAALLCLQVLCELLPNNTGMFLRRCRAELRSDIAGVLERLLQSVSRLTNDNELFDCIDILIGEGRPDLAQTLLATLGESNRYSASIIAASRARVLASCGRLQEGLSLLAGLDASQFTLASERVRYGLFDSRLQFNDAVAVSGQAALKWGEPHDLHFALNHLTYVFDFESATSLVRQYGNRFPTTAVAIQDLLNGFDIARQAAESALAEHGPIHAASRASIFGALSNAGTSASQILWGKQALVALLRSGNMLEADYLQFAWFLPNWEQAAIRHRVLAAALAGCPKSQAVGRGWLHYLIATRAYGDAALFCETLLETVIDADTLFFVVALLRLQQLAVVPTFMSVDLFEKLRTGIIKSIDEAELGFRFVMQDHLIKVGSIPSRLDPEQIPRFDQIEQRGFRRLFAVTTGRLRRVSTKTESSADIAVNPVLAISGQLRGFYKAWPSIDARVRQPTSASVVMSVWSNSTNAVGRHAGRLERALPLDIIERLKPEERYTDTFEAAYPRTAKLLFGVTEVDANHLRQMIDGSGANVIEVETENEDLLQYLLHPHISPNMLKMYYKFARLESLIREAEWSSGKTFSHVIWVRPDCEIVQLSASDLNNCLDATNVAWSSFVTETSFGDYAMVLPRPAFGVLASIFMRVSIAGDSRLLPWRPNRSPGPRPQGILDAFGGPDVIFDMLLAAGYMPLAGIPRMIVSLRAGTVDHELIRASFFAEEGARH